MSATSLHRPHDEAPPALRCFDPEPSSAGASIAARPFTFVSRGDFASGRMLVGDAAPPSPLLLVLPATGEAADDPRLGFLEAWADDGFAIARLELPLHGRRSSPKLSERLVGGFRRLERGETLDADTRALVEEFARQSVSDVVRAVAALAEHDGIDGERFALFGGEGLGAAVAAWATPHLAPTPRAIVLAGGLGAFADPGLDPSACLAASAEGSRWLVVEGAAGEGPSAASESLRATLPDDRLRALPPLFGSTGDADAASVDRLRAALGEALRA